MRVVHESKVHMREMDSVVLWVGGCEWEGRLVGG